METYSNIICFATGTMVATTNGSTAIERIKPKDRILSYRFTHRKTEIVTVAAVASSLHSTKTIITFENGVCVESTIDHPFWVVNRGWCSSNSTLTYNNYRLQAERLKVGDRCIYYNTSRIEEIGILSIENLIGKYEMYVVSGGENNCFFANGILVHDENVDKLGLTVSANGYIATHGKALAG